MKSDWCLYWDGYGLGAPNSGIFVHGYNLAKELCALGVEPHLIGDARTLAHFPFLVGSLIRPSMVTSWLPMNKLFWHNGVFRAIKAESAEAGGKPIIVHGLSNFNIPPQKRGRWRRVITIHDLIPLLAPTEVSKSQHLQARLLIPRAIKVADRIVCVSEWTKRTILEFMPEVADKVRVIRNGLTGRVLDFSPKKDLGDSVRILFVARFETYKGHELLVELMRKSNLDLKLAVITDARGLGFWKQVCPEEIVQGKISVRTGVYGPELTAAYRDADVYLSPSRYEGFCLPALEALCAGVPVVYRAGSGIDEVAGRIASVAVHDPSKVLDWDIAITEAVQLRKSRDFEVKLKGYLDSLPTWKEAASQLLSLYNELA